MIGDTAYDSASLREELSDHGTKPVIPNRCNRKRPSILTSVFISYTEHPKCVQQVEGFTPFAASSPSWSVQPFGGL